VRPSIKTVFNCCTGRYRPKSTLIIVSLAITKTGRAPGPSKQTPVGRVAAEGTNADSKIVSLSRLGRLRYFEDLAA
jgi:hypothetical protein